MDAEAYKVALNRCDSQISEMERTIHNLRNKIAEAEEARENAKGIRNDFDRFVARKKQKNSKQTKGKLVKSFSSFIARVTNLLTGSEYNQANERIEEINRLLSSKIKSLYDDLDYCERELSRLKQQRNTTYYEYMRYLKSLEEEVE